MDCVKENRQTAKTGIVKTYRAKDNTLYVVFTDKLIDICWAKRTDIEKMRKIAGTACHAEAKAEKSQFKIIHNSLTPVALKCNRGYYTNNATAQIETKYPIETKNNKDISFSYSLKPKNRKPQINRDEHRFSNRYTSPLTGEDKGEGERNYNTPQPNLLPQGAKELNTQKIELQISRDYNRNPINPVRKEVTGFKTLSGVWQVVENIKQRQINHKIGTRFSQDEYTDSRANPAPSYASYKRINHTTKIDKNLVENRGGANPVKSGGSNDEKKLDK